VIWLNDEERLPKPLPDHAANISTTASSDCALSN
jgi:hypothetical protein